MRVLTSRLNLNLGFKIYLTRKRAILDWIRIVVSEVGEICCRLFGEKENQDVWAFFGLLE
jgi:hypothetical protein